VTELQQLRNTLKQIKDDCLLVFVTEPPVTRAFEVRRSDADFSELHRPEGYRPEEAVFLVKEAANGWKKLRKG
jgi:hypothetical protein